MHSSRPQRDAKLLPSCDEIPGKFEMHFTVWQLADVQHEDLHNLVEIIAADTVCILDIEKEPKLVHEDDGSLDLLLEVTALACPLPFQQNF